MTTPADYTEQIFASVQSRARAVFDATASMDGWTLSERDWAMVDAAVAQGYAATITVLLEQGWGPPR